MTTTTTMWMSMLVHRYIAIKKLRENECGNDDGHYYDT